MRLHDLYPFPEEYAQRKRVGRGPGSGSGCTSGRGNKGQNSRSGGGRPAWFEGGQMPLARRLPKRGFKNPHRVVYEAINLDHLLAAFPDATEITLEDIYKRGLCKPGSPLKILSRGEVAVKVSVEAHRFSVAAAEKITKAGGTVKALEG
ncbi:MAG: 50S ribosomal protein L15 [Humidesulfovibrio sp.]|jgi:large subunit ribosomal protein L15|uniref:50S ribosomal protein L15 n=1 Tax=Humidesulfovibrio sp. TaxID=2910988 RepID=UPI0027360FFB|nr:50S ribosomal protein L15 [Humidesulfovibrio sp.]MDP2847272.1 50S ribosomal protein L15 [Humidesulfovibrio sp.]